MKYFFFITFVFYSILFQEVFHTFMTILTNIIRLLVTFIIHSVEITSAITNW